MTTTTMTMTTTTSTFGAKLNVVSLLLFVFMSCFSCSSPRPMVTEDGGSSQQPVGKPNKERAFFSPLFSRTRLMIVIIITMILLLHCFSVIIHPCALLSSCLPPSLVILLFSSQMQSRAT